LTDLSADPKDPKKNKVAKLLGAEVIDPAKGRVSHVFLAVSKENDFKPRASGPGGVAQPQVGTGGLIYVHQSQLNNLVVPKAVDPNAAAAPGAAPVGAAPAAPAVGGVPGAPVSPMAGTPWQGLITPANPNPAGILGLEAPAPAPAGGIGMAPAPVPATGTPTAPQQKTKKLTEFVVYLIWREPVGLEMNGLPPAGTPAPGAPGATAAPAVTPPAR
jgi:hypothetical protein